MTIEQVKEHCRWCIEYYNTMAGRKGHTVVREKYYEGKADAMYKMLEWLNETQAAESKKKQEHESK